MKYCIHCGSELEDEDKFCVHCGLSQSSAPEPGCQQEAVGQTSVSPASAAASKKPVNRAGLFFLWLLPLRWWLSFAWFCSCVPLRMKGRHPLPMLHRSSRLMILTAAHLLMTLRVLIPLLLPRRRALRHRLRFRFVRCRAFLVR